MQLLYCVPVIIVRLNKRSKPKVLDKINIDMDTHKISKISLTNQEISASHQEIEIIAT
jgi:hypothetical protein